MFIPANGKAGRMPACTLDRCNGYYNITLIFRATFLHKFARNFYRRGNTYMIILITERT